MSNRNLYINKIISHREYYSQYVNTYIKNQVIKYIGKKNIIDSVDENFSDIPLQRWDELITLIPSSIDQLMRLNNDYLTPSGGVCILKEAALQIKEESIG